MAVLKMDEEYGGQLMPRPNPPRKRPRRRPDAVERSTRAELSLAKQTAQAKERNGASPDPKGPAAKPHAAKAQKGAPPARVRRIDMPFVPWAKRSYAILVVLLAVVEVVIGAAAFFTLAAPRPDFWLYLLGLSYNPLIVLAAALVAAPVAKLITKELRALRFMESAMVGVIQYFIWLALFVALTYIIGGFASSSSKSSATVVATPVAVTGLLIIDVLSFVATFYLYPPLYRRMRIKPPPPRTPRPPKEPKSPSGRRGAPDDAAAQAPQSNVERIDEAAAREPKPKDPTP